MQGCTGAYKIAPLQRVVREKLFDVSGIGTKSKRIPEDSVRTWIGFSFDESSRIKEAKQRYHWFQYPLIAMRMTKKDVADYYKKINRPLPPRSVCNACFANDVSHFKEMYENRPSDWEQAVAVDDACRDLSFMRVTDECYVSSTLKSLRQLRDEGFPGSKKPDIMCQTGFCFL